AARYEAPCPSIHVGSLSSIPPIRKGSRVRSCCRCSKPVPRALCRLRFRRPSLFWFHSLWSCTDERHSGNRHRSPHPPRPSPGGLRRERGALGRSGGDALHRRAAVHYGRDVGAPPPLRRSLG